MDSLCVCVPGRWAGSTLQDLIGALLLSRGNGVCVQAQQGGWRVEGLKAAGQELNTLGGKHPSQASYSLDKEGDGKQRPAEGLSPS